MDSKVRTKAIFIVSLLCLLLFATVALFNQKKVGDTKGPSSEALEAESPMTAVEEDQLSWAQLQSFLNDPGFFDKPDKVIAAVEEEDPTLHIEVSTAMRDIRVCVVDEANQIVKGYAFEVVAEKENYTDLDEDGFILIPDIAPGDYFVSLKPKLGFHVPYEPVLLTVPEELLYSPLGDVAYRTDVAKKESGITYVSEQDKTAMEDTTVKKQTGSETGVDVSSANGTIDWKKVKESGITFAIICCGYRDPDNGKFLEDAKFRENIAGAKAAGLKVGLYFESQAISPLEAVEEASCIIALAKDTKVDLPLFLAFGEVSGRASLLTKEMRTDIARAFVRCVDSAGYEAGIFGSKTMLEERITLTELPPSVLWNGEYKGEQTLSQTIQFWQYTDHGQVDGIAQWVHLDLMTK